MRYLVNLVISGFIIVLFIISCSDSENELRQITDLRRDRDFYQDIIIEEDLFEYQDIIMDVYITIDEGVIADNKDIIDPVDIGDVFESDITFDISDIENIKDSGLEDVLYQDIEYEDVSDVNQCSNECHKGEMRCKDSKDLEICDDFNKDGCTEFGFFKSCENGCANNECIVVECEEFQLTDIEPVISSESTGGRYESTLVNGFHDDYLYNKTEYTKIGVRKEWGGSVIFFGLSNGKPGINSTNTIDANDTGREVQVAFYDPDRAMQNCAYNASCVSVPSSCPNSITFLGWDPVQGGNRCNVGSGVESSGMEKEYLVVSTIPLFWNPDWDRTDCDSSGCKDINKKNRKSDVRVIQKIRFITQHVVELDYTVINLSNVEHRATYQEMPTMYTSNGKNGTPDLYKLFDSRGNIIPIDQPAGGDGFYYKNFKSPDGWVAMQNESVSYGVGIYYENKIQDFQGWQLRSLPFNNVRGLFNFGIPANGVVRARAYLSLGNYDTIRSEFTTLDSKLGPFGSLDLPANDAEVSGVLNIAGWALDNKGVTSVYAVIDRSISVTLSYGDNRPDVCNVWPGYNVCNTKKVGFYGTYNLSSLTKCPHLLEIYAVDADNNIRRIGSKRFIVK